MRSFLVYIRSLHTRQVRIQAATDKEASGDLYITVGTNGVACGGYYMSEPAVIVLPALSLCGNNYSRLLDGMDGDAVDAL
jgi:hypothetical protein